MAISFQKAFGIHQHALLVRADRSEVLANNIANTYTPGFKAKDLDFKKALENAKSNQGFHLEKTHERHISVELKKHDSAVMYRVPNQPDTGDGNTVDLQVERSKFTQNALEYRASMTLLNGKIKGVKKALAGGGGR